MGGGGQCTGTGKIAGNTPGARRILNAAVKRGLQSILDFSGRKVAMAGQVIVDLHAGPSGTVQREYDQKVGNRLDVSVLRIAVAGRRRRTLRVQAER